LIAALENIFLGEPLAGVSATLGAPAAVVFHDRHGYQWRQKSGLVITVLTSSSGEVELVDLTAAPSDQPPGVVDEDSQESGFTLNQSGYADLDLNAPDTACEGGFGAQCREYHYDGGLELRADFAPNGSAPGVLREMTLADDSLLHELHFDP